MPNFFANAGDFYKSYLEVAEMRAGAGVKSKNQNKNTWRWHLEKLFVVAVLSRHLEKLFVVAVLSLDYKEYMMIISRL